MNDRGRIKWAPFLIPEHKKRIAALYEAEDDVKKPELDEQLLDKLQETIAISLDRRIKVTITYYQGKRRKVAIGVINKVDPYTRVIKIASTSGGGIQNIPLQDIGDIELGRNDLNEE